MSAIDFEAAQQRVEERRQQSAARTRALRQSQRSVRASRASSRLPFPLRGVAQRGIDAWDSIKVRDGTNPTFRVGQVDAELLDEELLELLRGQVGEGLKYFGQHIRDDWSSEILLGLRAALFKLSVWDHNASYGAALQSLSYTDARHRGPGLATPTKWQKALYGLITVGGRYGWVKWEDWLSDQNGGYEEPNSNVLILSRISAMASTTHSIATFVFFLIFLTNGRYRTLLDRVLRLRLASSTSQVSREVSFEYLNRQLVWHAFTEFLLFLLSLVGISRWRRWLSRAWRKTKAIFRRGTEDEVEVSLSGELSFLPERTCAICYQDQNPTSTSESEIMAISGASGGVVGSAQTDVTNPYETIPCGCVYCFICLAKRLETEEGEGWVCLRCGELAKECKPWAGEVIEARLASTNKKTVSFSREDLTGQDSNDGSEKGFTNARAYSFETTGDRESDQRSPDVRVELDA